MLLARMRCAWPGYRRGMATSAAVENAKAALKSAHAVCFDVDSTVCQNEGLCVNFRDSHAQFSCP